MRCETKLSIMCFTRARTFLPGTKTLSALATVDCAGLGMSTDLHTLVQCKVHPQAAVSRDRAPQSFYLPQLRLCPHT